MSYNSAVRRKERLELAISLRWALAHCDCCKDYLEGWNANVLLKDEAPERERSRQVIHQILVADLTLDQKIERLVALLDGPG